MEVDVRTGVVKWFDRRKGFGFIQPDNDDEDVFVHYSVVPGDVGDRNLAERDKVTYIQGRRDDGRLYAVKVMTVVRS